MLYGGIEAGGTKFICAVADEKLHIIKKISIPTTSPKTTFEQVFKFFDQYPIDALGIGSFGPIGIQPNQKNYGHILTTPKEGWSGVDFLGEMEQRYNVPIAWTTDVNAAAFGEVKRGAAKGKRSCIYLTIGTGIGGGIVVNDEIFQGLSHPEMGHLYIKRDPDDIYQGSCPYHRDCLEGLAAGPSLEARTGIKGEKLSLNHPIWNLQANYLAQALMSYTLILAPEVIVLGGGVMNQDHLLKKIRHQFTTLMADYMETPRIEDYIVPWGLANESGVIGTLLLAQKEFKR
ncbi:ROK family protein [Enterococcus xiangfangensis]|uniref:fructokinase n=1 Tax=Enterococcus xiangfangensis TaxID=1296537 RepID=A0ABU3F815_9ENTE|nr:ROK family protein [Enterococcus xiangfangensis]MDT2758802.1 ROK family protein [Enterococcus xiangfangensis]